MECQKPSVFEALSKSQFSLNPRDLLIGSLPLLPRPSVDVLCVFPATSQSPADGAPGDHRTCLPTDTPIRLSFPHAPSEWASWDHLPIKVHDRGSAPGVGTEPNPRIDRRTVLMCLSLASGGPHLTWRNLSALYGKRDSPSGSP